MTETEIFAERRAEISPLFPASPRTDPAAMRRHIVAYAFDDEDAASLGRAYSV